MYMRNVTFVCSLPQLVEITNSKLVAQESVLRLLTDQKKLFNSQAGAVSGLTAGESAA